MSENISKEEVARLVAESGFPFELQVTKQLADRGFIVQPSHQFFDVSRGKDTELDVVAILNETRKTQSGKTIRSNLRIGIECKDNSLPYVCFGLPHPPAPMPDVFDGDSYYCHIVTSRDDGISNRFAVPLFDSDYGGRDLKEKHHYFAGDHRFHFLGGVERKGKHGHEFFHFHTPEAIGYAQAKLGAFIASFHGYGTGRPSAFGSRSVEDIGLDKGPIISVCFTVLLHSGIHYRYTIDKPDLVESVHTPVFLSRTYVDSSVSYVLDLVQYDKFDDVLDRICHTFRSTVEHLSKWLFAV